MSCAPTTTNGTNLRQRGSALLGIDAICPPGTSTSGQYEMFRPPIWQDTNNATSSLALEAGHSLCVSPDTSTCHVGQDRLHASHSVSPGSSEAITMKGTSRPSGSISSASAALQPSLGNRLRTRLGTDGSTIYSMRWKSADTPAGRQYCQLVASARRISGSACSSERSGWPTPCQQDGPNSGPGQGGDRLPGAAALAGWPTPTTRDHKDGQECTNVPTNSLLGREVWKADQPIRITASGQVLTGSDAGTESSGQLNPAHSRWLMGYPPEWDDCGVTAMPLSRKSQPHSSKNSSAQQPKYQATINAEHAHV